MGDRRSACNPRYCGFFVSGVRHTRAPGFAVCVSIRNKTKDSQATLYGATGRHAMQGGHFCATWMGGAGERGYCDVCDSDDRCPGDDDTVDLNGNGVPDCMEIPTLSTWALVVLALGLFAVGRHCFRPRQHSRTGPSK